jgi:hypothetical protein
MSTSKYPSRREDIEATVKDPLKIGGERLRNFDFVRYGAGHFLGRSEPAASDYVHDKKERGLSDMEAGDEVTGTAY